MSSGGGVVEKALGLSLEHASPLVEGVVKSVHSLPSTADAKTTEEQLHLALSRGGSVAVRATNPALESAANFAKLSPSDQWRQVMAARDQALKTVDKEGQELVEQIKTNPVGEQALSIAAGVIEDFGLKDILKSFEAAQKGNVVDALKYFGMGGLNLLGELTGVKDLFVRFPDAVSRGDFVGAGLSLASGLFSIATFGAGSLITATARTALKSFLQTGAREAFEIFAKETAEQVGKYLATEAAKTLSKQSLREVVVEGFEAAGKEAAEGVAKEVAEVGAEGVSAETVKQLASEATEKATKKLLEDLGVDKLISELVERRLHSIADNKAISGAGEKLADDLRSLGVDERKINQMVMGARTQFKSAGKAGTYGEKFDEELIQIYTEAITKEVKEQLLGAGAKEGFSQGFDRTLTEQLQAAGSKVDEATIATWKKAAGEGFEEALEKGVRETVEQAVREGFTRFRNRGGREDSPASGVRPVGRNRVPQTQDDSSVASDDSGSGQLAIGGVSFADSYFAFEDTTLSEKNTSAANSAIAKSRAEPASRVTPLLKSADEGAAIANSPSTPAPAASTSAATGSGTDHIG